MNAALRNFAFGRAFLEVKSIPRCTQSIGPAEAPAASCSGMAIKSFIRCMSRDSLLTRWSRYSSPSAIALMGPNKIPPKAVVMSSGSRNRLNQAKPEVSVLRTTEKISSETVHRSHLRQDGRYAAKHTRFRSPTNPQIHRGNGGRSP